MGHEAIGVVEEVGSDVRTIKRGQVVIMPFAILGRHLPVLRGRPAHRLRPPRVLRQRRASTARSPKRCGFPRPTARSTRWPSARTTR